MGYVIVAMVIGFGGWIVYQTFHCLRRRRFGSIWWMTFIFLAFGGLAVGVWTGAFLEYQPSQNVRVQGFPLPLATFVLEEGHWTDFVPPRPVQYGGVIANAVVITAVALLPLLIVAKLSGRGGRNLGTRSQE